MNRRRRGSSTVGVAALAAVTLALAGCGSSAPSSSHSKGGGRGAAAGSILIGTELPLTGQLVIYPNHKAGMEAAVAAVNAAGGIDGHPLKLMVCDTAFNPDAELSCARQLISAKVVAIVGPIIAADQSGREYQLAEQAGIPVIDGQASVPSEFALPNVFPTTSGFVGWVYGAVKDLAASGARKIAIISLNNAAGIYGANLAQQALAHFGMKATVVVSADPQADPTFATAAAKAVSSGANGIVLSMLPSQMPPLLTAIQNAGYKGRLATFSQLGTPAIIKAAGTAANGLIVTAHAAFATDTANPGIASYLADMKKYEPNGPFGEDAVIGWSAVKLLAKVMSAASSSSGPVPTAAQALAAFKAVTGAIDLGGVGPFAPPPAKPYLAGYDRMFAPWVTDGIVEHGTIQPDGKGYVNPFTK